MGQDCVGPVVGVGRADLRRISASRKVPRRRVAGIMEPCGQYPGGELWGRKSDALEGEPEGHVGMCKRHDELAVFLGVYLVCSNIHFSCWLLHWHISSMK